ncbi:LCP family protein [Planobispora takensis]|uniref:Transcriptional regulator n=1 Tax=Planobispora takensis TaxID=1367882 RepID=A0A8J3T040_9ACTN|nr:LCP family protein [Planobispora takensis]GII03632.1 transcriptional regulator [Planobispora takensis]
MHLGQDSGDLTGEGGKRRPRRRGGRAPRPGDAPDRNAGRAPGLPSEDESGPHTGQMAAIPADPAAGPPAGQAPAPAEAVDGPQTGQMAVAQIMAAGAGQDRETVRERKVAPAGGPHERMVASGNGRTPHERMVASGDGRTPHERMVASGDGRAAREHGTAPEDRSPGEREVPLLVPNPRPAADPPGSGEDPGSPKRPRFARPLTAGALIGWTALSAILPGAAHLRAGRRRAGSVILGVFVLLLVSAAVAGLMLKDNTGLATRDGVLGLGVGLAGLGALGWFLLVLSSYVTLGPNRLNSTGQIISGVVVGTLCVTVMAPFALAASTVLTIKETVNDIFPSDPQDPAVPAFKPEDPWNGQERINFLLIGGDGAGNREGVRTDSMNVASIHIKTGNTVMFSLPRNLQHVRFPPTSPLAKQFPDGFMRELPNGGLLNEVWQYAEDHPEVMGGRRHQGPRALMDAIGYTLNLKIDHYALINMYGFAHLVDAIGGLKIKVEQDVKFGGSFGTAGTIKAGYRTLSGEEALWYGRSRVGSDDFSRMARQRCVIGAFAQQATPSVVLTNFTKIASVAKRAAQTNIPRDMLEHLTDLALKVKDARITSLQFVPPEFYSGSPDWQKIRAATARALSQSTRPTRRALAGRATPSPGDSGTAVPSPSMSAPPSATPSRTPTANNKNARGLDELCGL